MSNVELITITPEAERIMAYCARVSSPQNQDNPDYAKLLRYCMHHGHWSVFEHAHATMEIETSLAIATQLLRHRSFTFQQFSARYSDVQTLGSDILEPINLRRQDKKNRQNSIDNIKDGVKRYWLDRIERVLGEVCELYDEMLDDGIAKECARMVLPQATRTRLYMTGNIRSWIHYIQVRTDPSTQLEHRVIAEAIRDILAQELPVVAEAAGWAAKQASQEAS